VCSNVSWIVCNCSVLFTGARPSPFTSQHNTANDHLFHHVRCWSNRCIRSVRGAHQAAVLYISRRRRSWAVFVSRWRCTGTPRFDQGVSRNGWTPPWFNQILSRPKARFPLPELTARVNGPSWRVTGFHYPSTRAVLTGARFPLALLSTRPVNSGSGNWA